MFREFLCFFFFQKLDFRLYHSYSLKARKFIHSFSRILRYVPQEIRYLHNKYRNKNNFTPLQVI